MLLFLGACGGRSVAHEEATAGAPSTSADETKSQPENPPASACESLCDRCDLATRVNAGSCPEFCDSVEDQATVAGCAPLLDALVRCRQKSDTGCSLTACANQTNAFAVCVLSYCDENSGWPLCMAW